MKRYVRKINEGINRNVDVVVVADQLPDDVYEIVIENSSGIHISDWNNLGVRFDIQDDNAFYLYVGKYPVSLKDRKIRNNMMILEPGDRGYKEVFNYYISLRNY